MSEGLKVIFHLGAVTGLILLVWTSGYTLASVKKNSSYFASYCVSAVILFWLVASLAMAVIEFVKF